MSDRPCVVGGCHQTAAEGYFACQQHLTWKDLEPPRSDDWGVCTTCDQPTGSADLWQDTCPRCAELAQLEREIGRAAIGLRIIENMLDKEDSKPRTKNNFHALVFLEDWHTHCDFEADKLIARYRALLAAGGEEER